MKVGLIGNPNVGKSTIFNALTGMHQHTGNWPGKTVGNNIGNFKYKNDEYILYDLPGTYSLSPNSKEEEISRNFILSNEYDIALIICDACLLERNLNLVLQTLEITDNVILAINLMDEAIKKNIIINLKELSNILNVPVVGISAKKNIGINKLLNEINNFKEKEKKKIENKSIEKINKLANDIANKVVKIKNNDYIKKERKIDKILTSKYTGIPIMIISLLIVFWITISLSN